MACGPPEHRRRQLEQYAEGYLRSNPATPPNDLANILKELCQKGFIDSHRGVKGGYTLSRPAGQITLAELLESLEDGWKLTTCTGQADAVDHDCTVHNLCPIRGRCRFVDPKAP